jgi:predicted permease
VLFLLELGPALVLGLLLGRRWPRLPALLAPPLVHWGVPFSLTGLLLRAGLDWRYGQVALLALLAVGAGLLLVRGWFRGPHEQLAAVVGNTAYFGIPAALALLPPQAVGYAISYDLAATLFTWCLGPLLLAGERLQPRALLRALLASPASRGLLGACVLQVTPWRELLAGWLWWPARLVVLLSLMVVGMRLAQRTAIQLPPRLWAVLAVKLLLFPLALLALCLLLARTPLALPPLALAAVVLQAAAPTAVAVLLLAEATPQRQAAMVQTAAGLVLVSTLLALLTVPLWARLLAALGLHGLGWVGLGNGAGGG